MKTERFWYGFVIASAFAVVLFSPTINNMLHYGKLVGVACLTGVIAGIVFLMLPIRPTRKMKPEEMLCLFAGLILLSYTAINYWNKSSAKNPETRYYTVLDKAVKGGKHYDYYVAITVEGNKEQFKVPLEVYNSVCNGDDITATVYEGNFGCSYFEFNTPGKRNNERESRKAVERELLNEYKKLVEAADATAVKGDTLKAVELYNRAAQMNPKDNYVRNKLKELAK